MEVCAQSISKTNLANRLGLPLKRFAGGKGGNSRQKAAREKQSWKCWRGHSGVGSRLFIGGKSQRSKNSKLNGKKQQPEGILGISTETSGNRRLGRRFLLPRFSIPGFRWPRIASKQAPRHRGASVGGIRNQAFRIPKK
jgi:hypothetical protein